MSLRRVVLDEREIPQVWYNLQADLPEPLPTMLHPVTRNPLVPDDLAPIFPPDLIEQELSQERYIDIPGELMDIYRSWRPSPLYRALRLEQELKTPAKIYYKYEGVSPAGSHKLNTAIAQVYYNKKAGIKALTTETGAGQWGSSLSIAIKLLESVPPTWCKSLYKQEINNPNQTRDKHSVNKHRASDIEKSCPHTENKPLSFILHSRCHNRIGKTGNRNNRARTTEFSDLIIYTNAC
jgi:hypothetical protein